MVGGRKTVPLFVSAQMKRTVEGGAAFTPAIMRGRLAWWSRRLYPVTAASAVRDARPAELAIST
jgi:hypothetical protein